MEDHMDDLLMEGNDGLHLGNEEELVILERLIGDCDEPKVVHFETGIRPPPSQTFYKISSALVIMVQERKYLGLDFEDPIEHLNHFEKLMRTTNMGGASKDTINLTYFPFSLGGEAGQWEEEVVTSTILTWEDCKKSFMKRFYTIQRTAMIRHEMMNFKQGNLEELHDAWERFHKFEKLCPFHGIKEGALLTNFHNGLVPRYHEMLNVASGGSFAELDIYKGRNLIEKLSQSGRCYQGSYAQELSTLKAKQEMDDIREQIFAINQRLDQSMEPSMNDSGLRSTSPRKPRTKEKVNAMLCEDNLQIHQEPNSPPPPNKSRVEILFEMVIKGQERERQAMNERFEAMDAKLDAMYDELNSRIEIISSKMDKLEEVILKLSRDATSAILEESKEERTMEEQVSHGIEQSDEKTIPPRERAPIQVVQAKRKESPTQGSLEENKWNHGKMMRGCLRQEKRLLPHPSEPIWCFPLHCYEDDEFYEKDEGWKESSKFLDSLSIDEKGIGHANDKSSNVSASLVNPQEELENPQEILAREEFQHHRSSPRDPNKIIKKKEDVGRFKIPCKLGDLAIEDTLVDTGSDVNVISLSKAEEYGILDKIEPCNSSLTLVDESRLRTKGIIRDLLLTIEDVHVPIDLVVVKTNGEHLPLIFGRPLLSTVGANFCFENKTLKLPRVSNKTFHPCTQDDTKEWTEFEVELKKETMNLKKLGTKDSVHSSSLTQEFQKRIEDLDTLNESALKLQVEPTHEETKKNKEKLDKKTSSPKGKRSFSYPSLTPT